MSEKTMKNDKAKIEQIRMDFSVTPTVQRYVYLYLILGKRCYLIDGGVAGAADVVEERCIFTGDAIPAPDDIPIWVSGRDSAESLRRLEKLSLSEAVETVYPAWDRAYFGADEILNKIRAAEDLVECLSRWACHPLFQRTVDAMRKEMQER